MSPVILHRALSFSSLPVHRYDVSPLKVSAVSNRNEGLALLTTIAEGTDDCCNPSPLLSNCSPLEKNLISKIIHLREVLDLPLQSSSDALDQLLLDTLESLKIAYPKCISGQSGTISSVQQGLVHLHKVLVSVQDCYAERYQLSNLGSGKQPIIVSESLEHVGEGVMEMIDQVIPVAKEMFNFMESSRSANAAASAAWLEDLSERRTLPPVLCHIRSPEHFKGAGPHASDSAEVATPCQDGAIRHTEQLKAQKHVSRQEAPEGGFTGEDDQTSVVVSKLKGWKLAAPVSKQLDRLEAYFNKIKDDVDMIERNKDEEAKRFQSHSIHFDFGLLVRIKECMVDLSSNCMEVALKESEDAKETASVRSAGAPQVAGAPSRTLWRVFQLAFRVYNFAGGQDERADRLTAILAREIEAHPL